MLNFSVNASVFLDLLCTFSEFESWQLYFADSIVIFLYETKNFIDSKKSGFFFENSTFKNAFLSLTESNISLNKMLFYSDYINKNGAVSCMNCPMITINNSEFSNNLMQDLQLNGGGLEFISDDENINCFFIIENSKFYNNSVYGFGGALFSLNYEGTINNSIFIMNNANEGGAIYFDSFCKY